MRKNIFVDYMEDVGYNATTMCQDKIFYDTCRKHSGVDKKWIESNCNSICPPLCSELDSTELMGDDNVDNGTKFASEDLIATSTTQKAKEKRVRHKTHRKLSNSQMRRLIHDLWMKHKHSVLKQAIRPRGKFQ